MKYTIGSDFQESTCDLKTFGINENDSGEIHDNKIEIYGDEELRNQILDFLNSNIDETCGQPEPDVPIVENIKTSNFEQFQKALENIINIHCIENSSNTPDFILAEYIIDCLEAFNKCSRAREKWYRR